jgi:hypothetical protein
MHKNATKCNETLSKWCENKDGASKIIDTFETYHWGPTIYYKNENKRKLKAKIKTLQEKDIAYEAIKYSVLKDDLIFLLMKKRVPWGIPKL